MPEPQLPNLILLGAPASGVVEVARRLDAHPEIDIAPPGESDFFASQRLLGRSLDSYMARFVSDAKVRGDCCSSYVRPPWIEEVPRRIHETVPDAKLVYVVREPIARVLDEWAINTRAGREDRTIRAALAMLRENPYIDHSRYYLQLEQYWKHFHDRQILVMTIEELESHPQGSLTRLFRFLDVDPDRLDSSASQGSEAPHEESDPDGPVAGPGIWSRMRSLLLGGEAPETAIEPPRIDIDLRTCLEVALADDVEKLRGATGLKLDDWL